MNHETTCQLCQHLFSTPISLSCCPSAICLDCLSTLSYKKDKDSEKLYYNCPFCKKEGEEVEGTTNNTFLAQFIEYSSDKEKFSQTVCERCDKVTDYDEIVICNECNNKSLCKDCSDSIHSVGKFKFHERSFFVKGVAHQTNCITKLIGCSNHPKEKIEYICLKDSQLLCAFCLPTHRQTCKNNVILIR